MILYRSKTGAAKQYAEWLSDEISNSKVERLDDFSVETFVGFQTVIFVLPTYGGFIDGKDFLASWWHKITDKKVYLIAIGMVPQNEPWSIKSYNLLPETVRNGLAGYVKLPGIVPGSAKKKSGWIEKFASKVFLQTDLDKIRIQKTVKRDDLQRAVDMIKKPE